MEKLDVKRIYGFTGDALNGIADQIRKSENLGNRVAISSGIYGYAHVAVKHLS